jgi:hypothetical protein
MVWDTLRERSSGTIKYWSSIRSLQSLELPGPALGQLGRYQESLASYHALMGTEARAKLRGAVLCNPLLYRALAKLDFKVDWLLKMQEIPALLHHQVSPG